VIRRTLVAAIAALSFAAPAFAQQQPPQQEKPKTARETVMDKLKRLGEQAKLDSLRAAGDTAALNAYLRQQDSAQAVPTVPEAAGGQRGQEQAQTPALARDSLMRQLATLPGFTATEYKGISATFNADTGTLRLQADSTDKAVVVREGQTMTADSLLTFNQNTSIVCAYGKPVLSGAGAEAPVESQQVCYNTSTRVGMAVDATTTVTEGAAWRIRAHELYTKGTDVYGHSGVFTDCNLEVPHYHFSAGEIKVVNDNVMVARDVTLNFGDVPVFWLPFIVQSTKQGRRSGILMPDFQINDIVRRNSRYNRKIDNVGVYWAMNEYMGSKIAMGWYANNYTKLEAGYDFNFLRHFLRGGATVNHYWRNSGGRELTVAANSSWEPNERTNLRADVAYASSSRFVSEFSFDPRELNRSIRSSGGLSRRFDWGSLNLGANRNQQLSDNSVTMTLPSASLNLTSITLFPTTGEGSWYNNGTWVGQATFSRDTKRFEESIDRPTVRDEDITNLTAQSGFTLGKLSWSQNFTRRESKRHERAELDTLPALPEETQEAMDWSTSLGFQQRLIGTSTFTPALAIRGSMVRSPLTGGDLVSSPARIDASAQLKVDLFGFWPGVASVERIRHHISPSITYAYSPAPASTPRLDSIFGLSNTREQNSLRLGLSQTIEGKFRETESADSAAAAEDSVSVDPTQPRRIKQGRKVTILSINTDVITYDFAERKRGGFGFQTAQLSNSINSDLLRGLQLSVTHDLFRPIPLPEDAPQGTRQDRVFSPHLSRVSANFSLNANSWIFRMLGFGAGDDAPPATGSTETPTAQQPEGGTIGDREGGNLGLIGDRPQPTMAGQRGPVGSWNASFSYTLDRPRSVGAGGTAGIAGNSMLNATVTFQPTELWNVSWQTGYSISAGQFTDHFLTLTRALHDWDANFDFVKAQNGNFSFQFRVALRANDALKFDYEQRDNARRGLTTPR